MDYLWRKLLEEKAGRMRNRDSGNTSERDIEVTNSIAYSDQIYLFY